MAWERLVRYFFFGRMNRKTPQIYYTENTPGLLKTHFNIFKYENKIKIMSLIWAGAEDKRGQSVTTGYESHSWLYLSGHPVVCDRYIEVGAIVSSINPSLSMTSACLEVAELQQQLLWLLYDMKHLQRYPMAIGCLGM